MLLPYVQSQIRPRIVTSAWYLGMMRPRDWHTAAEIALLLFVFRFILTRQIRSGLNIAARMVQAIHTLHLQAC